MNIKKAKNIHFTGIGGIGMSALAQIFKEKGKNISGSDSRSSALTQKLEKNGIKINYKQKKENISAKHDLLVYSPAIPENNPELLEAKKLKIKTLSYPETLGELSKDYFTIAISGTHGKSTTTAIMALIAIEAELDPTIVIGTKIPQLNKNNYRIGKSNILILEACEYKESFLNLHPDILIITNIEADHLDYFKNKENYKNVFKKLVQKIDKKGLIIINKEDKNSIDICKESDKNISIWSKKDKNADYFLNKNTLNTKNDQQIKIEPNIIGDFNISNASFAAIASKALKIENKKIEQGIRNFNGTWRRMEKKLVKIKNKTIKNKFIDDYAHHPTEINATLNAIRNHNKNAKILCIFQPHQANRTKILLKEFSESFKKVDQVIIPNIYKVRDSKKDIEAISTDDLVKEINKNSKNAVNGKGIKETAKYIKQNHKKFDIIITMGAGDITTIYNLL